MKKFRLPTTGLPGEFGELLFAAWVQYFSEQRLGIQAYGHSGTFGIDASYHFGNPAEKHFTLKGSKSGDWNLQQVKDVADKDIQEIVADASARLAAGDFGGVVIYRATLRSPGLAMDHVGVSHLMRMMGDQVLITGRRRLGRDVLLEFSPELPENPVPSPLFTGATDIKVTMFIPGPIASDFTQRGAAGVVEVVAAICAFALGKIVEMPLATFPARKEEAIEEAQALRLDPSILNLARNGISLDIFGEFAALGDLDGVTRVRGCLLSYHAALQQASPDVAMMLLVSSMEALIVPRPEWRKDKATKRFIEGIDALCPTVVEELVNHPNVEQAFSYTKKGGAIARHRQLLDTIYSLRSIPTHSGIGLSGMTSMLGGTGSIKVALLSNLARGALLSFLQAPWSSLIGHPMFEPTSSKQQHCS